MAETVIDPCQDSNGEGPIFSELSMCWARTRDEAVKRTLGQWPKTALPEQLA
jgi:coenzyme F420-dependent glucose-6-phosphate dehydrogenase